MSSTTPSTDRADLRTLAAEALKSRADLAQIESEWLQQCGSCDFGMPEYGCTHPGGDYRPVMVNLVREIEALRRVVDLLPEHRRMVLTEAAEALDAFPLTGASTKYGQTARGWFDRAAETIRRLAAAAPPDGPSVTVPAETAPAVPEEADGQGEGGNPPRDDLDDLGIRAAIAEGAISCIGGDNIARAEIRESVADVQPLIAELRGVRAEVQRSRAGWTTALDELDRTRADRDRLARERSEAQSELALVKSRPLFSTRKVMQILLGALGDPVDEQELILRIDDGLRLADVAQRVIAALALTAPHQHECACNRNWGGPCGPCVCEEPPRQGVWRLTCGAENIPPNQTYATKGAAEDVMRIHGAACPGAHGVEFVPDAGTDQTEDDHA